MKKHLGRILAMAALVVGVAASRAHAVADYVVYEDATIPGGGGANVQDPQGAWEAYYCFAAGNACYIDSRNNAPVSPAGGPYIYIVSGANVAYGGGGTAFITSGSNSTQVQTDLSAYAGGNLTFYLKSDRNLQVEIQYGDDGTGNPIHSSKVDVNSTGGAWTQVSIPLDAAHFGAGVDYTKIRVPFLIEIPTQYATE